jgi:hypothetical protein
MENVFRSWNRAVGIATGYGLDDRRVGVRISVGARFSHLHVVQTGSWVLHPGVKRPGHEAAQSPPTSARVKNTWIYTTATCRSA